MYYNGDLDKITKRKPKRNKNKIEKSNLILSEKKIGKKESKDSTLKYILMLTAISFALSLILLFSQDAFSNVKILTHNITSEEIAGIHERELVDIRTQGALTPGDLEDVYSSVGGGEETFLEPVYYTDYVVKNGDTLWDLSRSFGISVDTIYSANKDKFSNPHMISIGMELKIPSQTGLIINVKSEKNLDDELESFDVDLLSALIANGVASKEDLINKIQVFLPNVEMPLTEKLKTYGIDFGLPCWGFITSRYGYRIDPFTKKKKFHSGFDIANVLGTKIKAAYDGVVTFAGWNGGYGNCIIIKHPLGYETLYGHLEKIKVYVGQSVKKGQVIGLMGSTGRSTGSHLHFEIRRFGKTINPSFYIKGLPSR